MSHILLHDFKYENGDDNDMATMTMIATTTIYFVKLKVKKYYITNTKYPFLSSINLM